MSDDRTPTAILGAAGYIGQHFARLLADHPTFAPPRLIGSERTHGQRLGEVWLLADPPPPALEAQRLEVATPAELGRSGVKVAFGALPSGTAGALESELVRRGVSVFSNASDHRREAGVPLLIPEVNGDHLAIASRRRRGRGLLVTNPNCSATGLALSLAPVRDLLAPRVVHVTTFQALSGAGYPGVPSLAIADNVVPYIAHEEEKVAEETRQLLGGRRGRKASPIPFPVLASCARVATREGHLESVTVEASRRPSLARLEQAWQGFDPLAGVELPTAPRPPILLHRGLDRPQPLHDRWAGHPSRARGMAAVVGRIRWSPPYLRFFVLSNNAVRGGAGGSVLNAEYALARGYLGVARR